MSKFRAVNTEPEADGVVLPRLHLPSLSPQFLFGGRAVFRVSNPNGDHYEYNIRLRTGSDRTKGKKVYNLSVRSVNGPFPYRFVGIVNPKDGSLFPAGKTEFLRGTKEYDVAQWALYAVMQSTLIEEGYEIQHAGKCGRCNRTLSVVTIFPDADGNPVPVYVDEDGTVAHDRGFHISCWRAHEEESANSD